MYDLLVLKLSQKKYYHTLNIWNFTMVWTHKSIEKSRILPWFEVLDFFSCDRLSRAVIGSLEV